MEERICGVARRVHTQYTHDRQVSRHAPRTYKHTCMYTVYYSLQTVRRQALTASLTSSRRIFSSTRSSTSLRACSSCCCCYTSLGLRTHTGQRAVPFPSLRAREWNGTPPPTHVPAAPAVHPRPLRRPQRQRPPPAPCRRCRPMGSAGPTSYLLQVPAQARQQSGYSAAAARCSLRQGSVVVVPFGSFGRPSDKGSSRARASKRPVPCVIICGVV